MLGMNRVLLSTAFLTILDSCDECDAPPFHTSARTNPVLSFQICSWNVGERDVGAAQWWHSHRRHVRASRKYDRYQHHHDQCAHKLVLCSASAVLRTMIMNSKFLNPTWLNQTHADQAKPKHTKPNSTTSNPTHPYQTKLILPNSFVWNQTQPHQTRLINTKPNQACFLPVY